MSGLSYTGLTWDHPRGYVALNRAAEAAAREGLALRWERQPLEGFESHPIEELAARYDLLVLDHPHIGDAVAAQCLQPLEAIFDADTRNAWRVQSIGNTFESYRYAEQHWALPLDAAAQVAATRSDLVDAPPPAKWSDVVEFARQFPVALSLAGPHAILTLFSISAAHGDAPAASDPGRLFIGNGATAAWNLLLELHAVSYKGWSDLNPIAILEAMSLRGEAVYCPLVYGYVNYAVATGPHRAVTFLDVPAGRAGRLGSVLGGTGLAVTRRTTVSKELRAHLAYLLSIAAQRDFIAFADGQPSAGLAWSDPGVNAHCGNFFAATQATLEQAIVRPRHPRYVAFQTAAAQMVRDALARSTPAGPLLQSLQSLYAHLRPANSEI